MIWGLNNVENMSSNRWLIELGEARVIGVSAYCWFGGWEGHPNVVVVAVYPRRALKFFDMRGYPSRLVFGVLVRLTLRQTNATFYRVSFSLMLG